MQKQIEVSVLYVKMLKVLDYTPHKDMYMCGRYIS